MTHPNPRYKPSGTAYVSMHTNDIRRSEHKSVQEQFEEFFAQDGAIKEVPPGQRAATQDMRNFVINPVSNVRVKACS